MKLPLHALLSFVLVLLAGPVLAQPETFPSRTITLVLPAAAGTGVDLIGRVGARKLAEVLGRTVVVENVVGASGVTGVQRVVRSRPDGYTLLLTFNQTITMNPHFVANLPYAPEKDLAPVSRFAESPFVWLVNSQVPINSFPELLSYAKAQPGKLAMGVTGFASAAYLGSQLLAQRTGAEVLAVPYAGNFSADLLSNTVQLSMSPAAQVGSLVATGKVRALAQTGAKRSRLLPSIPTVSETVPGLVIDALYGVWAPAGTPAAVLEKLTEAWRQVATASEVAAQLEAVAASPVGSSAQDLSDLTRRETQMWGDVVRERKIKPAQ